MECGVQDCKNKPTVYFDGVWFCKDHAERWSKVEIYVQMYKNRLKKAVENRRKNYGFAADKQLQRENGKGNYEKR